MIPDFKTYLRESIWSDMQDRGTGDVIKKEDDIDLMDIEDFKAYLKKRYICTKSRRRWKVESWFLGGENTLMQVDMPIEDISEPRVKMTYTLRLTYDYGKMECIDIASSFQTFFEEYPEFKKYVSDNYQLIKKSKEDFRSFGSDNLIVSKPGKELKFHNYVELIDKALSCVEKPYLKRVMNESVWSDMQDRGTNTILKKEDEVNILGLDGLCKYLNQIYGEFDHRESITVNEWKGSRWLSVDLASTPSEYVLSISYDICPETEEKIISISYEMVKDWLDFNKLEKRYNSKVEKNEYDNDILSVYPKDGSEVTNEFLIDVIDYMLGEIPPGNDKYIYRKNNESIWSDMEDRGTGELIKKEDDLNTLDRHNLFRYIGMRYKIDKKNFSENKEDDRIYLCILELTRDGGFRSTATSYYYLNVYNCSTDMFILFFPDMPNDLRSILEKNYEIEHHDKDEWKIFPKNKKGTVNNQFYIELIDYVLENAPKGYKRLVKRKIK